MDNMMGDDAQQKPKVSPSRGGDPTRGVDVIRRNGSGLTSNQYYTTVDRLPRWFRRAAHMKYALGMSWAQVAKRVGKAKTTLESLRSTPAGKKLRDAWDVADDPVGTTKLVASLDAPWIYFELIEQLRACKKAGDRAEAGRITRALADISGLTVQKSGSVGPTVVQINIGNGQTFSTELPMGDSSSEIIKAEVIEE
jgi:hypothetical protein